MRLYEHQPGGTVERARKLRRDASAPERRLLRGLREAFSDLKWRHQAPIGAFYADTLCFSEKLVIEVDGDTHANTAEYDARRTAFLNGEGYRVIRVTNADAMRHLDGVIAQLSFSLREKEGAQPKAGKDEGDGARS